MLSHKNTLRLCTWTGACLSLLYPLNAFAQGVNVISDANTFFADVVVKIITALNLMTWILFGFLNFLLDPAFMFNLDANGGGNFMDMLNEIWQLARDLVNLALAIVLVFGAVYTIATANKDMIMGNAKKFVIVLVAVNFSWFVPRVILDVANVATSAIFGIPSLLVSDQKCQYTSATNEEFCTESTKTPGSYNCECALITNMRMFVDDYEKLKGQGWKCPANELFCYQSEKLDADSVASYSAILNGLIVNHGRLRELGRVPRKLEGATNISGLVIFIIREIILLVLHIGLFFPLLAMTVAFFIRIPVLWVTIAFMPFAVLQYILNDEITQGWPKKISDNFIKAAFLPAMVAIPLSIGFIMINAGSQITGQAANVSIRLFDGVNNLWELLWMCMSMGVLWVGVFNVLKESGVMGAAAGAIQNAGQSLGSAALGGTVGNIPLPMIGGGKMNLRTFAANMKDGNPFNDGKGGGGAGPKQKPADVTKAAKDVVANPAKLDKLNDHLRDLTRAIQHGSKTERDDAIRNINRDYGNVVTKENPGKDIEELKKKVEKEAADAAAAGTPVDAAKLNTFKVRADEVKAEAARAPAAFFASTGGGTGAQPLAPYSSDAMPLPLPVETGATAAPQIEVASTTPSGTLPPTLPTPGMPIQPNPAAPEAQPGTLNA